MAPKGLSSAEAARRVAEYGPNALPAQRRPPVVLLLLLHQFTSLFAVLLWVASLLALVAGTPELSVAIIVVIAVNGVFAFVQEYRADRAVDQLRALLPVTAVVHRDGHRRRIPASELVPGDLVELESGDRVSADLSVGDAASLQVDESTLTGESVTRSVSSGDDMFAGTFVVEGAGNATVTATGAKTRLASIAALTGRVRASASPLAQRLSRVVRVVAVIATAAGALLYLAGVLLGLSARDSFIFALGVTVALVPEGLMPTVTLSLSRGAHAMARRNALVRRLDSVETLGSVTFICSDKTGTLTRNEMSVVEVWTLAGTAAVSGSGYDPSGRVEAAGRMVQQVRELAYAATRASRGRLVPQGGDWHPHGDPMEVALHVLAMRAGTDLDSMIAAEPERAWYPFDRSRMRSACLAGDVLYVKGAPEPVLADCRDRAAADAALRQAHSMAERGLRVLAVARITGATSPATAQLEMLGVVGLLDPPRPDVTEAIEACRRARIRLAMITGDHPGTARAVAAQVGLSDPAAEVVTGDRLPDDERALADLVDRDGVVLARVSPEQKLRIARALRGRGHIIAMTGDGVNDAPALREADIGIAMGATGSDVARETADLVLLDDHFATIVSAVEVGRATFANIKRFLTYHLSDNAAELAPFTAWALTGGAFPLAIGVLQVLALDIGTDLLPALALGAEPPNPRTMSGPARTGELIDRRLLARAFLVLGATEAVVSLGVFAAVLTAGGWTWGADVPQGLLPMASGTAFAGIVLGQLANTFACRSETRPAWAVDPRRNPLLLQAVIAELIILVVFLTVPPFVRLLGGAWPGRGWLLAALAVPAVVVVDAVHKRWRRPAGRREG